MNAFIFRATIAATMFLAFIGQTGASRPSSAQRIDITAKRFSYTPNEITVTKGKPVTLVFHSADVNHGFASDDFNVKIEIPKHQTGQVTFVPSQVGDFGGKCAHFCGAGHGQMQLTIHVKE
ncbi:MAG TPA: cupredoxin domain-containing protein [Candidatus Koribacter sp.]|jgi:cytochrome c oxidase subunit 2